MISRITISLRKNVRSGSREDDWLMNEHSQTADVTTFAFGMGGRVDQVRQGRELNRYPYGPGPGPGYESDGDGDGDHDSLSLESIEVEVPINTANGDVVPMKRLRRLTASGAI